MVHKHTCAENGVTMERDRRLAASHQRPSGGRGIFAPLHFQTGPTRKKWFMAEVDRFLIPEKDRAVIRFFLDHLFIPHSHRERFRSALLRNSMVWADGKRFFGRRWLIRFPDGDAPPVLHPRGPSCDDASDSRTATGNAFFLSSALEALSRTRRELLPDLLGSEAEKLRWILRRDHPSSKRQRLVAFLLRDGEPGPFAVLKLQSAPAGPALEMEWNALQYLRTRLPEELLSALPRPLHYARLGQMEVLLQSCLPGRSMDVEMGRRPVSRATLGRHLVDGAVWLACFHMTTRSRERCVDFERETAPLLKILTSTAEGIEPGGERFWTEPLNKRYLRIPLCARHGDFGAWNLLVGRRRQSMGGPMLDISGVVDWEYFETEAAPFADLFHFALTYGLDYPWTPYRKYSPEESFRLAFLEESPVSMAIRSAFSVYCDLTGTPREALRPLFHFFLLRRWCETRKGNPDAGCRSAAADERWLTFHRLLARAGAHPFDE